MLTVGERQRAAELFLAAADGRLDVAVHAGAQTTADTAALAAHAAEAGAAGVAVIAPPYYPLDGLALEAHLAAAAEACAPLPFYVYEFAARSGYEVPIEVVERLRERLPNLRGLKVSDKPWEKVEPYMLDGLDVFIGAEALVARGLAAGAAGAVSGLASAYPEVVAALVHEPSQERSDEAERLRASLDRFPFQAAAKAVAGRRGVPIRPDVRPPLRRLTDDRARNPLRFCRRMCFDLDSAPPIPVIAGAAISHEDLELEAADGNSFAAFAARPDEPFRGRHRRAARRARALPLLRGGRAALRRARVRRGRLRLLRPHRRGREARRRLPVPGPRRADDTRGNPGRRRCGGRVPARAGRAADLHRRVLLRRPQLVALGRRRPRPRRRGRLLRDDGRAERPARARPTGRAR